MKKMRNQEKTRIKYFQVIYSIKNWYLQYIKIKRKQKIQLEKGRIQDYLFYYRITHVNMKSSSTSLLIRKCKIKVRDTAMFIRMFIILKIVVKTPKFGKTIYKWNYSFISSGNVKLCSHSGK